MKKIYRMFVGVLVMCSLALSAFASAVTTAVVFASGSVGVAPVSQKLDADLAHAKSVKVSDHKSPTNNGYTSGGSGLSFVQMLTAINGRSEAAFA